MTGERLIVGNDSRYRIGARLGAGYYAEVFEARELVTNATFAAKVYPADPSSRAAATCEIAAFEALSHPRMPMLHDAFEQSGCTWLVMDVVPGPSLREVVERQGPLELAAALRMGVETSEFLEYCRTSGWTYRDLHPRNIHHLTATGVTILDFDGARGPDARGELGGRIGYRAPEVANSVRVHPACQVFSVAGCIHFALTGEDPPPEPGGLPMVSAAARLSPATANLLERCRDRDPEARPSERQLRDGLLEEISGA